MSQLASSGGRNAGPGRWRWLAASLVLLWGVALTACGSSSSASGVNGVRGASEVTAQPVSTKGTNPFTAAVGKDSAGLKPPSGAKSSSGGPTTYSASTPGLYGGTRNYKTCNASQLVSFLQQNPSKGAAWASTLGIPQNKIGDYVSKLTSVLLRTDTRVTNHGYVNGQATSLQALLEAGTAVMVDQYGRPVVKCYCGNPLTTPTLLSSPVYTGPTWAGFSTTNITIIQQSTTIINVFKLYDPSTGMIFTRTPGANGTDGAYEPAGAMANPAPMNGSSSSGGQSASTENPSVSLSPNPVTAGDTVTLSGNGFLGNKTIQITVNRPDGGTDNFQTTSDGQGNVSYTFSNAGGSATGTYTVTATDQDTGAHASATILVQSRGGSSPATPATPQHTTT